MIAPEVESTVPIAAFVSDVARKFLAVAEALDVHEDYATQITTTEIKDELTRFKVSSDTTFLRNNELIGGEGMGWEYRST